ncbi:MAG TPA: hypothetical protein VHC95_00775 [Opitutales bacterium]|nr:hypothetical protein [Opitutales bacterium]
MVDFDNVQRRLQSPPPPPPRNSSWVLPFIILVVVAAAGAAWYYFYWQRRPHQEQTLAGAQGQSQQIRLESRKGDILKYTLLSDNTTHYVPISSLPIAQQDVANRLSSDLDLEFPLECFMGDKDHPPASIRVEGRSDNWVRFVSLSDNITHYEPLQSFSTDDQTVLKTLPAALTVDTPLDRPFHDSSGAVVADRLEARNSQLAKLTTKDGAVIYYPVHELSSLDQSLIDTIPYSLHLAYPLECTVTDKSGRKLAIRIEGRNAETVKYTLLSDGRIHYTPDADFSTMDRKVFQQLPIKLEYSYPFDYTLTDAQGQPHLVRLEGRNIDVVKFTVPETGHSNYWPVQALSIESQKFLGRLPSNLHFAFPFDATLISQAGQSLDAHVLGRDATAVKFQLADGKTYVYDIAKLSDNSQKLLRLLSANLPNLSGGAAEAKGQLDNLRDRLAGLMKADAISRANVDAYNGDSGVMNNGMLDGGRQEIIAVCKEIDPLVDQSPKTGNVKYAQAAWSRAMAIIHQLDQIQKTMDAASGGERQVQLVNFRAREADLISALNEIHGFIGAYAPPAAN